MRRLLLILAVVAGCGILEPDEVCGCTPALFAKSFSGEVLPPADQPITGVRVITESMGDADPSAAIVCEQNGATLVRNETSAAASGVFSTVASWPGTQACARIWAQAQGTHALVSDTLVYQLDSNTASAAVSGVVLQLREVASP